jgi:UDP-N-acetyl-D-mannosaminuronate dehydrogenase
MAWKNKQKINLLSSSRVGILGYGEVGQAIAKFYRNPRLRKRFGGQARIKDLSHDDGLAGVEILHICIPWSKNFIKIVKKEIKEIKPKLTIIHSTISPGTTQKISGMVVHSPVRGIHPHLYEGIKKFMKYIGADNEKAGKLAKRHLEDLGMKTKLFVPSVTTEIGKLLDTNYYGLCISWHGEMAKICDKFGVDFKKAVTDFNKTYNEGYIKLNKKNVVRPILYPPKKSIGGHCILLNAKILKKYYKSKALDLILKYKSKTK